MVIIDLNSKLKKALRGLQGSLESDRLIELGQLKDVKSCLLKKRFEKLFFWIKSHLFD